MQQLYSYQAAFGVRMVRLDVYPGPAFGMEADDLSQSMTVLLTPIAGTTTAIAGAGCCNTGVEQLVSISNSAAFPTAGLKT